MFRNLLLLVRYRGLIQSLVARELKARYRGSVLGFCWSFVNPLLLLLIYSFVFTKIIPNASLGNDSLGKQPYAVFLFCGLLPWNWFQTSLLDAAGSLIAGGNLIKKVMVPAERSAVQVAVQHQPVHSPRCGLPGDSVLRRSCRALEMAAGARRRLRAAVSGGLLAL